MLGIGCAMRECSDEVRLGISRLLSSRVGGRADSFERGRAAAELKEGAMIGVCVVVELLSERCRV